MKENGAFIKREAFKDLGGGASREKVPCGGKELSLFEGLKFG